MVVPVAFAVVLVFGLTAANTVASSRAGDDNRSSTAEMFKPAECAGITVTTIIVGVDGGTTADLLLGGGGVDLMDGKQADDCILGGGGDDTLRGGPGTDVCIGGPGTDTFHPTCEATYQ